MVPGDYIFFNWIIFDSQFQPGYQTSYNYNMYSKLNILRLPAS